MTSAADTLRAIEARAERAIVQELHLMTQEILRLRTHLVLEDRAHADALLMKLDHLGRDQVVTPRAADEATAFLMPLLRLEPLTMAEPKAYKASFYDHEYGDLEDVVTVDAFETGVQVVRDRLPREGEHVIEATWANGHGLLTVTSPRGTVLARLEALDDAVHLALPPVLEACQALRLGDASSIVRLFGHVPNERALEAA
jgi:hypothetical protein